MRRAYERDHDQAETSRRRRGPGDRAQAEIFREFTFEAAHRLPFVPDDHKCSRLHGHSYRVEVRVGGRGRRETRAGWSISPRSRQAWKPLHEVLDHNYLNEVPGLENPDEREPGPLDLGATRDDLDGLAEVVVRETCTSGCFYRGEVEVSWRPQSIANWRVPTSRRRLMRATFSINEVGIEDLRYPIGVSGRMGTCSSTVAECEMTVELSPKHVRGTHMSRFVEVLDAQAERLSRVASTTVARRSATRLETEPARVTFGFPYFLVATAPVSGLAAMVRYEGTLEAVARRMSTTLSRSACACRLPASVPAARRSATTALTTSADTSRSRRPVRGPPAKPRGSGSRT